MKVKIKRGCIDPNMNLVVEDYRRKNNSVYNYIYEFDDLCNELEASFRGLSPTAINTYVVTTFCQIHSSFQSVILLLEHGMYDDSQILFRSILDKVIKCIYVLQDDDNFKLVQQENNIEQIKTFKYALKHSNIFNDDTIKSYNEIIIELQKKILVGKNGKELSIKKNDIICEEANMPELYFAYKHLSGYTHNQMFVPGKKIFINKNIVTINNSLEYPKKLIFEISTIISSLGYVVKTLCKYISASSLEEKFINLEKRINESENIL